MVKINVVNKFLAGRVIERGQSEVRYQYDQEVKLLSAIIITYSKMVIAQ